MASKRPTFTTNGTHRPVTSGALVARGENPYGNPCGQCGARRYERCFSVQGTAKVRFTEEDLKVGLGPGDFIYTKDKPCANRVPLKSVTEMPTGTTERD